MVLYYKNWGESEPSAREASILSKSSYANPSVKKLTIRIRDMGVSGWVDDFKRKRLCIHNDLLDTRFLTTPTPPLTVSRAFSQRNVCNSSSLYVLKLISPLVTRNNLPYIVDILQVCNCTTSWKLYSNPLQLLLGIFRTKVIPKTIIS